MRCIDAVALKEKVWDAETRCGYVQVVDVGDIDDAPTIEPERKTGRWIKISPAGIYECSECGKNVMTSDIEAYEWCHGCGAKMEETEK